ncbi:MAG: DUF4105 domain-containing protein [Saprospiraceae bacterium]
MKKLLFLFILIFFCGSISAQAKPLSSEAKISLLTCSPGEAIYELFGHTAIRVKDPSQGLDMVFNYGIFDFDTPNFVVKFVRGKLLYKLGVDQYRRFEYQYAVQNRRVIEQVFNFNPTEKQTVFNYLLNNAKPENAYYQYDFFYDNCSSRVFDVLKDTLRQNLTYAVPEKKYLTYRQQLDYYINGDTYPKSPWADFGMDLILGMPADEIADFEGETYLPDHLSQNFTFGTLRNSEPLVQSNSIIVPQKKPASVAGFSITPLLLFWILCGLTGLLFLVKNNTFTKVIDFILFLLLGLSGTLFVFMWMGTDHEVCHKNLNMLWMNPFHILLAINILRNNLNSFWKKYLWLTLFVNVLLILFWKILPQDFHAAAFPIILLVTMRVVALLKMKTE